MAFLKRYRNEFFDSIRANNLDFSEIRIIEKKEDEEGNGNIFETLTLKHLKSDFIFKIRCSDESYDDFDCCYTEFRPGNPTSEYIPKNAWYAFSDITGIFDSWIKYHLTRYLDELSLPDMLEAVINPQTLININQINFEENIPFLKNEINLIKTGLNEIKGLIGEKIDFTNSEMILINNRIDYLSEGVERLSKTDWKGVVISTIIGIITTLSLDSEKGKLLWDLFLNVLNNLPQISGK